MREPSSAQRPEAGSPWGSAGHSPGAPRSRLGRVTTPEQRRVTQKLAMKESDRKVERQIKNKGNLGRSAPCTELFYSNESKREGKLK